MAAKPNESTGASANTGSPAKQDLNEGLLDDYVGKGEQPEGSAQGQETVSREQFDALQRQLVEQQAQFDQLMKLVTKKAEQEGEDLGREVIPPAIQMAEWLMNGEGVVFRATPRLKERYRKHGLHPCPAPAGYDKKKKAR